MFRSMTFKFFKGFLCRMAQGKIGSLLLLLGSENALWPAVSRNRWLVQAAGPISLQNFTIDLCMAFAGYEILCRISPDSTFGSERLRLSRCNGPQRLPEENVVLNLFLKKLIHYFGSRRGAQHGRVLCRPRC